MMRRLLIAVILLIQSLHTATAQDRATLIADSVTVQSGTRLLATGNVEVFFKGVHLTAASILYDQATDTLLITGPIQLDDGKGTVFFAAQADLSADLTEGLLTSARLVLNQQLQLAAAQIVRSANGNLTTMRRVAASSCTICAGNSTPLWEIRAREVVHDALAQKIYFRDASLRFYGIPIMYLPILRVPDPTLSRATGFLIPRLRATTALGTGVKIPYFIAIGDSKDLTLTPYFTVSGDHTVELSYRQAFQNGSLLVEGSATFGDTISGTARGYVQATGSFDLGNDYIFAFNGISVSDPGYLLDFGISESDRLDSQVGLSRVQRNQFFSTRLIEFVSLREGEINSTLPSTVTDLRYERRFEPDLLGGTAGLKFETHSDYRTAQSSLDTNADGVADGRDLARASIAFDWRRNWTTKSGIVISALSEGAVDAYSIVQDASFAGTPERISGSVGLELRWPWAKSRSNGTTQMIEPVVQMVTSSSPDATIPNGDSTLVEFDEGNLFALDRYPGADAIEGGTRLNIGVNYRRDDPNGWSLGATAGRVVRLADLGQFSNASGLSGAQSDWLLVWTLENQKGLGLTNRVVFDDSLSLTKGELRFDFTRAVTSVSGGYEYLLADVDENRPETASEIVLDARRDLTKNWSANLNSRYDLRADRLAQTGLKLNFHNECVDFTLSLSRRYTSSTSVQPSTDFGLSVELLGFGGSSSSGPSRSCRR